MCRVAVLSLPAACHGATGGLTFDQRWTGPVTPDQPSCGPATQGTLTRRADDFTFTPNDGVLVIAGHIKPDGHLDGTLALIGADHRPYPLTLEGTLTQAGFEGVYTTPRCTSHVSLHPPA